MITYPSWPCTYSRPQIQEENKIEFFKESIGAQKLSKLVSNLISGNVHEQLSLFEEILSDSLPKLMPPSDNIFKSFFDFLGDCSPDSDGKITATLPLSKEEWQKNSHYISDSQTEGYFNSDTFCTLTGIDSSDFISVQVKISDDHQDILMTLSRYVGEPF